MNNPLRQATEKNHIGMTYQTLACKNQYDQLTPSLLNA